METDKPPPSHNCGTRRQGRALFSVLLVLLIAFLLFFGLRSKNWPDDNGVSWVPNQNALSFHPPAIAYTGSLSLGLEQPAVQEFSIHLAVSPSSLKKRGFRPILMIHAGDDAKQLALWHWGSSVIVMNGDDYDFSRRLPRIYANNVLQVGRRSLISIVSGNEGTRLYLDGEPVRESEGLRLHFPAAAEGGRLVLGNSVYGNHGWYGEFYGLCISPVALSSGEVREAFGKWVERGVFTDVPSGRAGLFYAFVHGGGGQVMDFSGNGNTLIIPKRPVVLAKSFLTTPGHNVHTQAYWLDVVLNALGFIPLGMLLCWGFCGLGGWRFSTGFLLSVALCFCMSLGIELAQAWLPARSSSLQDLSLNTLGGAAGSLYYPLASRFGLIRRPS